MYLTAHLVRSRDGEEGINAFLHLHGAAFVWPQEAARLPDTNPGDTVRSQTSLPPGGNSVRAYLDILAPDGTARNKLEQSLMAFARDLSERRNPTVFHHDIVVIRFGVELGLEGLRAQQLDMLVPAAMRLFDDGR
ncbi:MAG: hypothetical protein KIT31_07185 [Deltaproteobacteria bacterium]|nr:hypothetical protein [Deltaproteobacteria bacterium]